jgi:metal-dependent amidase/aminoacylase/carboxypeptidase family protein
MVDIRQLVSEYKELVINSRRDLHRIPEIGYTEEKTSAYVADYLRLEGLEVQTEIAQFGVVGLLETGRAGPPAPLISTSGIPGSSALRKLFAGSVNPWGLILS